MVLAATGGALAAVGVLTYAVRGRSSRIFAPSVHRGPRTHRAVALTFDDGPSPSTPVLLEILAQHRARATFFFCGIHVRRWPAIARATAEADHEIGNHSDTHPLFCFRSGAFQAGEIGRAQATLRDVTGRTPRLFRAPYGVRWPGLRAAQQRHGLLGVMWTVIGRDWTLDGPAIAARLLRGAGPGAILCLHDGRVRQANPDIGPTLEAVRRVVPALHDQGYEFRTVTDLLCSTS